MEELDWRARAAAVEAMAASAPGAGWMAWVVNPHDLSEVET